MPKMRVYFDICALKRGWDDHSQLRVKAESDAMESLLQLVRSNDIGMVHSAMHDIENEHNEDEDRRIAVDELLSSTEREHVELARFDRELHLLIASGVKPVDAAHVASAICLSADVFVTTDDRLLRKLTRSRPSGAAIRATGPIQLLSEFIA